MQNYVGPVYFGELKPYNSKHCSIFVLFFGLQLIFAPFNFAVLLGTRNSRNKGHANIKGYTVAAIRCLLPQSGWRRLVNAYEGKADMV